ncbi:phospholipase D-like domain-containing protein [Nocardioides sp. BSK12Z-3]|nr:phospholipase D-like domain-containing protein [Nocardioides bruguierae]MCL8024387.1 phospholipase D-like domain-containing protein [Nocardioides bruguierae]
MGSPLTRLERLLRSARRALLAVVGFQLALAAALSLVDAYRRRGKRSRPFPVTDPRSVEVGESRVTTYTYGADVFDAMVEAIQLATRQILFETYIWKSDRTGERIKEALVAAADRGVEVYCIYDSFANLVSDPRFKRFPSNVHVLPYPVYPAGLRFLDLRRYGRDHRKILVVDSETAFVGGYNVGDEYASEWRDTHLRIVGPAVWDLQRAFADFWNLHRRRRFRSSERPLLLETAGSWETWLRVHRNVPRLWMFPIRGMYLEAINRASERIWLTTAYFLPDQDFVDALKDAAARGVDVRIIVPLKSNHVVADWASRGYYAQLLASGVRIFRFVGAMVHAKTCTIDGTWTTVGTANIDRLSLSGNYEINVEVVDGSLAEAMEEIFATDCSNSLELTLGEWQARDMHRKFTEAVLGPLRPLL